MTLTIIIPVYNAEAYLGECLDSIISQPFNGNYEIVLVNDGSTDGSLSVCEAYAQRHTNIKVVTGKNAGVSAARNKALDMANGKWLLFVDADDKLLPGALATLYERAKTTGADIILGNAVRWKGTCFSRPILKLVNETLPNVIFHIKHFALWGYLVRRNIVQTHHLRFVEGLAYSEDRIFIYQLARYCQTIAYTNTLVYAYRINPTSVCQSKNGLIKAKHHFLASFHMMKEAESYKEENSRKYTYLRKAARHIISLGVYQMLEQDVNRADLKDSKSYFDSLFGKSIHSSCVFYGIMIKNYLTIQRRKLITFRKQ